jgi:hypothetical protein
MHLQDSLSYISPAQAFATARRVFASSDSDSIFVSVAVEEEEKEGLCICSETIGRKSVDLLDEKV